MSSRILIIEEETLAKALSVNFAATRMLAEPGWEPSVADMERIFEIQMNLDPEKTVIKIARDYDNYEQNKKKLDERRNK